MTQHQSDLISQVLHVQISLIIIMTCTLNLIRDQTTNFTPYQIRHAYLGPTESIVLQNVLLFYNNLFILFVYMLRYNK